MKEHEGCENCRHYTPDTGYEGKCRLDSANPRKKTWNNWCRHWRYGYTPPKVPRRAWSADVCRGELHKQKIKMKLIDECGDVECAAKLSGALAKTLERMVG